MNSCVPFILLVLLLAGACTPLAQTVHQPTPVPVIPTPHMAPAQTNTQPPAAYLHFGQIGLEAGLSQSVVMATVQDSQGFMWFGTQDGLNRYDGQKFQIYNQIEGNITSLSDVWVCSLALDASGNLWAGTRQGGANRFDARTGTFTRFQHHGDVAGSISDNNVHVILNDAQGRLWFGTELGLDLFDPQSGTFSNFVPPEMKSLVVRTIASDAQGLLWLGTPKGLWRFDPATKEFTVFKLADKDVTFVSVVVAPNASLWLASAQDGLWRFEPHTATFKQYTEAQDLSSDEILTLLLDPSGWVWVGTSRGLDIFDPIGETFQHYQHDPVVPTTLSNDFIMSLYRDRSGILWIGSFGGSLNFYDPLANKFIHYYNQPKNPASLGYNSIFSIAADPDGAIWVGTYGGGLDRFDPQTGEYTHYRHNPADPASLQSNNIFAILPVRDNLLWIGTETGVDWLDPATSQVSHLRHESNNPLSLPAGMVFQIYRDSKDVLWVGAEGGLARFDPQNQTFIRVPLNPNPASDEEYSISQILEDAQGDFWIGTHGSGLFHLDSAGSLLKRYTYEPATPGTISNNAILAVHESDRGQIWIGTAGSGLNYYDPLTESFVVYNETNGLPNNYIYGILEDDMGGLWLSTNRGLARFDPQTATVQSYTTADGLQSNEFNMGAFAEDGNGFMYFGGINGMNVFNPAALKSNRFVPPVSLVSVTQNGQPLTAESEPGSLQSITLRYPDTSFEFEFAALSYSQSEKNQYAYQLDGFDGDWYYAGTNRIGRYSNLPGGHYTLRLKAANSSGIWNETPLVIQITVIPPFWQTTWFYALAVLTLLAGVLVVYRLRVHEVELQKRELERQVSERTREIEQLFEKTKELAILEERNRLARDLHDSAKQKAFAALAQLGAARSLANGNLDKGVKHLQEAETLVGDVIQEITFLIQEIHPVALKEKGLAAALREYVFEWSNRTGIDVDLRFEGECALVLEIEQVLYRAIQEALANVARHSEASSVLLALTVESSEVNVTMADNGRGFDPNRSPNGMGLHSIRERVEGVGGRFVIESAAGQGTRLSLHIPLG